MHRSRLTRLFYAIIALAAYGYLIYRLCTYSNYDEFAAQWGTASTWQYAAFFAALALFPLNIAAEAVKWRYLLRGIYPMGIREAVRQVYIGTLGAFITPGRVGDYPMRVTAFRQQPADSRQKSGSIRLPAIALGFVGSFALCSLQVIAGFPAALYMMKIDWYVWLLGGLMLFVYISLPYLSRMMKRHGLTFGRNTRLSATIDVLAKLSAKEQIVLLLLSAMRYSVYCLQLALLMYFCSIEAPLATLVPAIATYYLLVTLTPSVPVADAGIRGSWAIVVFSLFTENVASVAIAAVSLWVINAVLPMIVGSCTMHNAQFTMHNSQCIIENE